MVSWPVSVYRHEQDGKAIYGIKDSRGYVPLMGSSTAIELPAILTNLNVMRDIANAINHAYEEGMSDAKKEIREVLGVK